jgi:FlaA1/EpsC-like NDP-sugar epimerase
MLFPKISTPRWMIVVLDLFLSIAGLFFAYLIRFDLKADTELIQEEWEILSKSLGLFLGVKLLVFYVFKIHKGLVRYTSSEDLRRIFIASVNCSFLFLLLGLVRHYFFDAFFLFPMSVLLIEFLASISLLIGFRFCVKLVFLESNKQKAKTERVLIYGAGVSGLMTKTTIEKDVNIHYEIIGFLDDNKKMDQSRLQGLKIFHTSKLDKLIEEEAITLLIVAIQKPNEKNTKKVVDTCLDRDIAVNKVPSLKSWVNGEFTTKQIRKVRIEDLLGRKPIVLDEKKIAKELDGKVVLVTGAAGSIGGGMVLQIGSYEPTKVVLLDQAESGLYDLQNQLFYQFPNLIFEVVVGDIRNFERMERVFEYYHPNYVFHAAAYKHVPLMENNPSEAILTNVLGTKNLVDLSNKFGVEKFVMISTDKAVNPTNVMGASKRIAEIYAQTFGATSNTKFVTTRFGNVLGSNGSVIPLFQKQIEQGGPITLTDERITRFFMTIPEACQLVLEAAAMGEGGEIFVFDMGESVKIIDLAKKMIQLSGLEMGKDIEIKITGLRPGEKLFEELLAKEEDTLPTYHPQILRAKIREEEQGVLQKIQDLIGLFDFQKNEDIVVKMKEIVPEYISNNSEFELFDKK